METHHSLYSRSHDKRGVVPKAVKFAPTVTEFPSSRFDEDSSSSNSRTGAKSSGHKFASGHSSSSGGGNSGGGGGGGGTHSSPGHSPGHSVPGHNNLGQYNDRTVPDGESGHGKSDTTSRKLSAEK